MKMILYNRINGDEKMSNITELIDYGYEVEKISMKEQTVIFNKIG